MVVFQKLFSPIRLGRLEIKNRIVMPPMVSANAGVDGMVTQGHLDWYEARARGGVGLIIVEFTYIGQYATCAPYLMGIWHDRFIPGLSRLAETIHFHGTKAVIQLGHAGRQTASDFIGRRQAVAPSAISCPLGEPTWHEVPKELSVDEIEEIIEQFGEAAGRAKKAGFDGVEIHGAHGYLISGFMSPYSNKRNDEYGGDLAGRMSFPLKVVGRVRKEVGDNYVVGFRFSGDEHVPDGRTIEESRRVARLLENAGVDYLHVTAGVYESFWSQIPPYGFKEGTNVAEAAAIKQIVGIPVITVGRIKSPEVAEEILQENKADMVAVGRQLICDPDWPLKAAAGQRDDIRPCIGCTQGCINRGIVDQKPVSCLCNPMAAGQKELAITPAGVKKRVLIAGGGPAGLEAAEGGSIEGAQRDAFRERKKAGRPLQPGLGRSLQTGILPSHKVAFPSGGQGRRAHRTRQGSHA